MNLRHLEVFHAVMRTGSVTAAAHLLHISQPAVSALLRHYEDQMKLTLFVRHGPRLVPTPEARVLFPDVAAIFERMAALERLGQDLRGGRQGSLSVAACFPMANGMVAKVVANFLHTRPGVRISLYSGASPAILQQVAHREVDLGIAYAPVAHPEIASEILLQLCIACVMPADHPLAGAKEIRIADLKNYPVVTYLNSSPMRSYLEQALAEAGIVPNIRCQVSLSLTGMVLAREGVGVALVEPSLLSFLGLRGLVARPLSPPIEVTTLLLRHQSAPCSQLMEEFVNELHGFCQGMGKGLFPP